MRGNLKKVLSYAVILFLIYPFGLLLGITFVTLRWIGTIKIAHWERFPHFGEGILLVANHPSLLDPFLLAAMFYKRYLLNPLNGPLIVADQNNFYNSWYWFWLRLFLIPVERGNWHSEAAAVRQIKSALEKGRAVIMCPEGGRTCRGDKFLPNESSPKKIRILKGGVGLLVRRTKATVVPVWIEGTEKFWPNSKDRKTLYTELRLPRGETMTVNIGEPLHFSTDTCREEVVQIIAGALLSLADEDV